jgi:tetratricopeptide (TPR) repeat protein
LVLSLFLHPSPGRAVPIEGRPGKTLLADNGRYVITSYTGPFTVIWDMNNLWDYLQPVQVHAFRGSARITTSSMPVAISEDGKWLAYLDHGEGIIRVCRMGPEFPCRTVLSSVGLQTHLDLSPDGSQLFVQNSARLRVLGLSGGEITVREQTFQNKFARVDWNRGRLVVIRSPGSIEILSLADFSLLEVFEGTVPGLEEIYFSSDGKHLIFTWRNWVEDKRMFDEGVKVYPLDAGSPAFEKVEPLKNIREVVLGSSPGELWYARFISPIDWVLIPAGPNGDPQEDRRVRLSIGQNANLRAVSIKRNLIIVEEEDDLFVYDLKSRLPIFRLYNSKVKYSRVTPLPHLYPRLGADPLYATLMRLSYSSLEDRKTVLLWTASLATRRHQRYDLVWYSLLHSFQIDEDLDDSYLRLSELVETLVKFKRAGYLARMGDRPAALQLIQSALRARRAAQQSVSSPGRLDPYNPTLDALVSNYWLVVERDLWVTFGNHLAVTGRKREASLAYREALKIEPQEWRAYYGLLNVHREANDATFNALLTEAQSNLRMVGWTEQLDLGYPPDFFLSNAVRDFRSTRP